jgi:thermitase
MTKRWFLLLFIGLYLALSPIAGLAQSHAFGINVIPNPTPDLSKYPKDVQGRPYIDGQVLVHFDKKLPEAAREGLVRSLGYEFEKHTYFDGLLLKVPNGTVLENIERLKNNPLLKSVFPNYVPQLLSYTPYPFPNDPNYQNDNDEWTINAIHMDQAWNSTDPWISNASLGRSSAVIAVMDTGITTTHEDFAGKIASNSWDFAYNDSDVTDSSYHGTTVAGIAGADVNNGKGGTGVCANCSLMILKIYDNTGGASGLWTEEAFNYAIQNGAKAINCSFGVEYPAYFQDYSTDAFNNGCLVVGAMANDGNSDEYSPASDPNAIGAGAVDSSGNRCSYSDYGSWIGMVAPVCSGIFCPYNACDTCYAYGNGTSGAAPQVSAMAAILLDLGLTPTQVKNNLYTTADVLGGGFNVNTGNGRLNAYRSLSAAEPPSSLSAIGGASQITLN